MVRRLLLRPLAVLAVLGVGLLALGACASDDDTSDVTTGGTDTTTSSVAPATTTTAASGGSSTTASSGANGASPEEVSQILYGAYVGGNRDSALTVATPEAVDQLFDSGVSATGWALTQCRGSETVESATECDFGYVGGQATFLVEGNDEDGYQVTTVGFIAE